MTSIHLETQPGKPLLPKLLYTRQEAAEILSLSVRTIDTLIATHQMQVRRIGRCVRVPADALYSAIRKDRSTQQVIQ